MRLNKGAFHIGSAKVGYLNNNYPDVYILSRVFQRGCYGGTLPLLEIQPVGGGDCVEFSF
jgi:hypothetical protein